ncbi:DMT family transporter [Amycolatopsis sp. NPDC059657]|uniref:DMT family transporter n=1 Tax=Amycolatopsis sp. NPDC059657 TaxID=3346899 RepID=UPI0036711F92
MSAVLIRTRDRSAVALVLAGVLWGTGGLAGSVLSAETGLHPLAVAAYRLLLGGCFAVGFLWLTGGLKALPRTKAVIVRLITAGALLGLFQSSYFIAVSLSSVSIATMTTIGSVPVFVAVASAVSDRRRPSRWTVLSIAVALAGLVLLRWSPVDVGASRLFGGLFFALLAGAGFATLTLVTGRQVEGLDPLRTTAFGCLIGGLLLTPAALAFGMGLSAEPKVIALALYLGAVPTALAYAAYLRGLTTAHPVLAALSALLEPVTAAVLSAVLLGDRLGPVGWSGAALLVGALALSYWRPEGR